VDNFLEVGTMAGIDGVGQDFVGFGDSVGMGIDCCSC
jgi:hypothetical protein